MKHKHIAGLIMFILGVLLVCSISNKSKINDISLSQNVEVLLDGEATFLFDCNLQSGLFNSGAYACVCNELTTDSIVYPCSYISSATPEKKKCTLN